MAIHSSVLAWEMPWTEEPGALQSMGSQRVRHNLVTKPQQPESSSSFSKCGSALSQGSMRSKLFLQ